jgi:hypothetical protein
MFRLCRKLMSAAVPEYVIEPTPSTPIVFETAAMTPAASCAPAPADNASSTSATPLNLFTIHSSTLPES